VLTFLVILLLLIYSISDKNSSFPFALSLSKGERKSLGVSTNSARTGFLKLLIYAVFIDFGISFQILKIVFTILHLFTLKQMKTEVFSEKYWNGRFIQCLFTLDLDYHYTETSLSDLFPELNDAGRFGMGIILQPYMCKGGGARCFNTVTFMAK